MSGFKVVITILTVIDGMLINSTRYTHAQESLAQQ